LDEVKEESGSSRSHAEHPPDIPSAKQSVAPSVEAVEPVPQPEPIAQTEQAKQPVDSVPQDTCVVPNADGLSIETALPKPPDDTVPGKVTQAEDQSVNADDQAAVDLAGRL
jgi:hypothetical protein